MRAGMSPGGMKRRVVDVDERAAGRQRGGGGEQVGERRGRPARHVRMALLQQPQAADVAQEPGAAVDADLVGEVRGAAGVGEDRRVELEADQRPGAAGDVGEALGGRRHADDRRGGVVRADGGDDGR